MRSGWRRLPQAPIILATALATNPRLETSGVLAAFGEVASPLRQQGYLVRPCWRGGLGFLCCWIELRVRASVARVPQGICSQRWLGRWLAARQLPRCRYRRVYVRVILKVPWSE